MNPIYIVLQVIVSLYCIDLMIQNEVGEFWSILIIGVHLVVYLLGAILKERQIRVKICMGDMLWLVGCMVMKWPGIGIIAALLCAEYVLLVEKKGVCVVLVGIVGLATLIDLEVIRMMWGAYLVIGVLGWFIYRNEKRVTYLLCTNQTLKEEAVILQHQIERITKEKSQIVQLTQINERNLMAQRLHDKIGHTLAGNIMQLEVVKLLLGQDTERAAQMVGQITDQLRAGMDDIRMTLRALKPEQGEVGIEEIKKMLRDVEASQEIKTYLHYEGDLGDIGINKWQVISESLREYITNFLKYSQGNQINVSVQNFNQVIRVSFEDNGKVEGVIKKGLGIRGIEERMAVNNGRMVLNTDEGFQIILIFHK
ncbi:MAG: sensor histidine kinase [Cellulosilyticaceae bacterium]